MSKSRLLFSEILDKKAASLGRQLRPKPRGWGAANHAP